MSLIWPDLFTKRKTMYYQVVAKVADFLPEEISLIASKHFKKSNFKGLKRYSDVVNAHQGVYAFISSDKNIHYLTDTRCPYETTDIVYVLDCHN